MKGDRTENVGVGATPSVYLTKSGHQSITSILAYCALSNRQRNKDLLISQLKEILR